MARIDDFRGASLAARLRIAAPLVEDHARVSDDVAAQIDEAMREAAVRIEAQNGLLRRARQHRPPPGAGIAWALRASLLVWLGLIALVVWLI